jgi:hypothetical protein
VLQEIKRNLRAKRYVPPGMTTADGRSDGGEG